MTSITQLNPREPIAVDRDRLGALYVELGETSAEDIVCRAMEELALRMSHCTRLYRIGDMANLRKSARSLIAIAEQIGMGGLAIAAEAVTDCVDRNDRVALAATLTRLMRTGEGSLTAVWELQDVTV